MNFDSDSIEGKKGEKCKFHEGAFVMKSFLTMHGISKVKIGKTIRREGGETRNFQPINRRKMSPDFRSDISNE